MQLPFSDRIENWTCNFILLIVRQLTLNKSACLNINYPKELQSHSSSEYILQVYIAGLMKTKYWSLDCSVSGLEGASPTKAGNIMQQSCLCPKHHKQGFYPSGLLPMWVWVRIWTSRELSIVLQWSNQDRMHHTPSWDRLPIHYTH